MLCSVHLPYWFLLTRERLLLLLPILWKNWCGWQVKFLFSRKMQRDMWPLTPEPLASKHARIRLTSRVAAAVTRSTVLRASQCPVLFWAEAPCWAKVMLFFLCLLLLLLLLLFLDMAWIPSCTSIAGAQWPFRFTVWNWIHFVHSPLTSDLKNNWGLV